MGIICVSEPTERDRGSGPPAILDHDASFATVIEVIDHTAGRLIACRHFDSAPPFFFGTDLAFASIQDDVG